MLSINGPLKNCLFWHDYRRLATADYGPSGNIYPATLYGGATLDSSSGLVLDGLTGYGQVSYSSTLNTPTFSVAFHINGAVQDGKWIVARWVGWSDWIWILFTATIGGTTRLRFQISGDGSTVVKTGYSTQPICDGTNHHVVFTYDGSTALWYRDGLASAWGSYSGAGGFPYTSTNPVIIGRSPYVAASLRNLQLFNDVLTPAKAASLAAGGY